MLTERAAATAPNPHIHPCPPVGFCPVCGRFAQPGIVAIHDQPLNVGDGVTLMTTFSSATGTTAVTSVTYTWTHAA